MAIFNLLFLNLVLVPTIQNEGRTNTTGTTLSPREGNYTFTAINGFTEKNESLQLIILQAEPAYTVPEFPYRKTCHYQQPHNESGKTYDIALFYHVGMLNNWKNIVYDQLDTLEKCGLGYMASSLTLSYNLALSDTSVDELSELVNQFPFSSTCNISYIEATAIPWEQEAIKSISNHCLLSSTKDLESQENEIHNQMKFVYYFHNKGITHYTEVWKDKCDQSRSYCNVLYWPKYMEWFLLENPTFCLTSMLNGSALTCGVDLLNEHSWHYSGNFWAASCQWIEKLPKVL